MSENKDKNKGTILGKVGEIVEKTIDVVVDTSINIVDIVDDNLIEKASSPSSRAGLVIGRVGSAIEDNVDAEVIALQMTKNSVNNNTYSEGEVLSFNKLYLDSKGRQSVFTAKQATALKRGQKEQTSTDSEEPTVV